MLERYHLELLNFLSRQVHDRHTAADLTQESFARVLGLQSSGQSVTDVRALLYRIARNLVVDQHRRDGIRRHEDIHSLPEHEHPWAPSHLQPDEALAAQEIIRAYASAIEALPPRCREAFMLRVFDEMTHREIAHHMGISESMVVKHLVRGLLACKLCQRSLLEAQGMHDGGRSKPP